MKLVITHDAHGKPQREVLGRNAALRLLLEKSALIESQGQKPDGVVCHFYRISSALFFRSLWKFN
jgi:hypothetical protein